MRFKHSIEFETGEKSGKSSLLLPVVYVLLLFGGILGIGWLLIRQFGPKVIAML